jgi:hypothetical protein
VELQKKSARTHQGIGGSWQKAHNHAVGRRRAGLQKRAKIRFRRSQAALPFQGVEALQDLADFPLFLSRKSPQSVSAFPLEID